MVMIEAQRRCAMSAARNCAPYIAYNARAPNASALRRHEALPFPADLPDDELKRQRLAPAA